MSEVSGAASDTGSSIERVCRGPTAAPRNSSVGGLDSSLCQQHADQAKTQYLANTGPSGQSCGFSSGHVWM